MKEKSQTKTPDDVVENLERIKTTVDGIQAELAEVAKIENSDERANRLFETLRKLNDLGKEGGSSGQDS